MVLVKVMVLCNNSTSILCIICIETDICFLLYLLFLGPKRVNI